jgi:hypothetical protein
VFAIQSEIAQTIANQLRAKLSPREEAVMHEKPTSDMAAYDLYLQARRFREISSLLPVAAASKRCRRQSFAGRRGSARSQILFPALCALVRAHMYLHWIVPDPVLGHVELARNALEAATRLQPDSGDVHLTRAWSLLSEQS